MQVENNAYYIFQVLKTTSEVRPPVLLKFVMRRPAKKNSEECQEQIHRKLIFKVIRNSPLYTGYAHLMTLLATTFEP